MATEKHKEVKKNNWLMDYKKNITSYRGENGILEKIFEILDAKIDPSREKWCVEFGAGDGKTSSNTWDFIMNKGWSAVLIEADKKLYKKLLITYENINRVTCLKKLVSFSGLDSLDNIFSTTPLPNSFDLISIDIDGNDYHIWESMRNYKPKVVIIEYNPTFPNHVKFIQRKNMNVKHGSSILSLVILGKEKGYELIAVTDINAIFVKDEYFDIFEINDNALINIRNDKKYLTYLYQLYDGTILVSGRNKLIWHGKPIRYKDMQLIPRFLRRYPGDYPLIYKYWMRIKDNLKRILKIKK